MNAVRSFFILIAITGAAVVSLGASFSTAEAATAEDLNRDAHQVLQTLYKTNSLAADVSRRSRAVLVFPNIIKAGLIFGAGYGEGVLMKADGSVAEYYNSFTGSWGLQAGAQTYGYAVFLMSDKALKYLEKTHGLELGVGPTVVFANAGAAKNLSSSTLRGDAYAFIFDQQGLMVGINLEGTKISRISKN